MNRYLILSATILLLAQASPALAQVKTINVTGQLNGGNFVSATCTVGNNGQFSGTGVLYGTNPSNGYSYKYPFTISGGSTASGKLVLTGKMTAGPAVTLSATVPNGAMSFSYVIGGKTYTYTGTGTVTVK